MPTPMYVLRVAFSSLVIRVPSIRSCFILNQRMATFVTYILAAEIAKTNRVDSRLR